ncbi:hypothetical protein AVEN_253918-1 [Araneus ventricosus]|uniref:DDE-1 domain-containing protein n=1 Tax=Araneus ventricosus TaxID=182803 RepID=A0A4Y2ELH9_ARAVE|nr:hypothetical protein AVEN_253918-1 [Araneus ventricosus]
MWVLNSNENLKFRKTETSENDVVLMKWFCSARAKNIPVNALKKVEPGCVLKCFKRAGFLSKSEVATVSTTEKREKELADLVANLDSNVSVEEYVKFDDDLSIEKENLNVSNFIHRDTTEALALSEDDDEESPMADCKIKDYSEALN